MLNEELSWTEVGALSTGSGSVSDAFQLAFGDPTKELLPAGMSLYKFNGFSTLGPGTITDATDLSPWWSPTAGEEPRATTASCDSSRQARPTALPSTRLMKSVWVQTTKPETCKTLQR